MKFIELIVLSVLLLNGVLASIKVSTREDLPPFWDDVPVNLYYVEAAIGDKASASIPGFGEAFSQVGNYHAGLAFQVHKSPDLYVLEFKTQSIIDSVLPHIELDVDGLKTLSWKNEGFIEFARVHPTSYWDLENKVFVGKTSGATWNKFLCFLPTFKSQYQLFNVYDNPHMGQKYVSSSNAADFVWEAFSQLKDVGVKLEIDAIPRKQWNLYTDREAPALVDMTAPGKRNSIITYYQNIQDITKLLGHTGALSEEGVRDLLIRADYDRAYIPAGGHHYYELHLNTPVVGFVEALAPVGAKRADGSSVFGLEEVSACIAPASDAEFWMWKMAAFLSFFMGTFFLYKAYHVYLKRGPYLGPIGQGGKPPQRLFATDGDPYVALTMSMLNNLPDRRRAKAGMR